MQLNDIWVRVGDHQVFSGLNLFTEALRVGLIGRNGSGKSSLLSLLQGLIKPQRGSIELERPVGLVFQNPDHQLLFPTVLEELSFSNTQRGMPRLEAEKRARELACDYNASHLLDLSTQDLSMGQKALVNVLSVLIDEPKTLLLDESFSNLDLSTARRMMATLASVKAQVIFSTHQTHLIEDFDEVLWLEEGGIRMQGTPLEVIKSYEQWSTDAVRLG